MEHSSHAHPLPRGRDVSFYQQPLASSYASCAISSPALAAAPPQQLEAPCPQTRRLQLRNAGFRGSTLPSRHISPIFGLSHGIPDPFSRVTSDEKRGIGAENRSLYGEDLPPSPVNILQEIQKSTRKKKHSPRPAIGPIFEDNTMKDDTDNASGISWYREGSNQCSPAAIKASPINSLRLREGSLNPKVRSPSSSPLPKQMKRRKPKRLSSASVEASKHIEYLESQLASVNAKLDSLTSPNTNKLRSARLRALTAEARNLRLEVAEWEKTFADRVQEEVNQHSEVEMELKIRLRTLEEDVETKDARIGELEWELGSMRVKIRDTEDIESINQSLEKRIDVLTNVLARSPSKLDICSATTSPNKADPTKRRQRPKSMFSKAPSSPGGVRLSQCSFAEAAFWRSSSFRSTSSIAECPEELLQLSQNDPNEEPLVSPTSDEEMMCSDSMRSTGLSRHFESRPRAPTSFRSAPSPSSRPTSVLSDASCGPPSWGLPLPAENEPRSPTRQRKMRRFPSGSSSLKPLILPTATVVPQLPASGPIYPSIDATAQGDISHLSLDPTTAFLSKPVGSSPTPTPGLPPPRHSNAWAQNQTLKALEGTSRHENGHVLAQVTTAPDESCMKSSDADSAPPKRCSRPRSLQKELEEAETVGVEGLEVDTGSHCIFEEGLIAVNEDYAHRSGQMTIAMDSAPSGSPLPSMSSRRRLLAIDSEVTPKPSKNTIPLNFKSPSSTKALSTATVAMQNAYAIFFRLTNLINQTKQDPFIFVRRLISSAWAAGSKRLGGMGWWLLGLIYHRTKWRKRKRTADNGTAEDIPQGEFDWHHFSAEASRMRTADHHLRDYGGTWQQNIGATSPTRNNNTLPAPTLSPKSKAELHLFPCKDCVEPSSRRTLRLWFQFSLAIILAVGVAIKDGPGTLLEQQPPLIPPRERQADPSLKSRRCDKREGNSDCKPDRRNTQRPLRSSHEFSKGRDSGYGSITFAETLGPRDFEHTR